MTIGSAGWARETERAFLMCSKKRLIEILKCFPKSGPIFDLSITPSWPFSSAVSHRPELYPISKICSTRDSSDGRNFVASTSWSEIVFWHNFRHVCSRKETDTLLPTYIRRRCHRHLGLAARGVACAWLNPSPHQQPSWNPGPSPTFTAADFEIFRLSLQAVLRIKVRTKTGLYFLF